MGRFIIKPDPDRDFYVYYSTIVDSWIAAGTMEDLMLDEGITEERMARADKTGSSSLDGFYSYASREKYGSDLMFRDVGPDHDTYDVPYANVEALITEQFEAFEGGMKSYSEQEQAIFEKHGTRWVPE